MSDARPKTDPEGDPNHVPTAEGSLILEWDGRRFLYLSPRLSQQVRRITKNHGVSIDRAVWLLYDLTWTAKSETSDYYGVEFRLITPDDLKAVVPIHPAWWYRR